MRQSMILPPASDFLSNVAYDSVIFGFNGKELKILLIKYHNTGLYALPGGFVRKNEDLNEAVKRGLRERTGLDNIYLEQFYTFGDFTRSDPKFMKMILESRGITPDPDYWMLNRFLSVAYYALINYNNVNLQPDFLSDSIDWHNINELPTLMQDHNEIVEKALQTLRDNLDKKLVGINLLPEQFTMKELQLVYEAILGEKLRRTTFQRKMLSLGVLNRHEKRFNGMPHKAPYLYSFKEKT